MIKFLLVFTFVMCTFVRFLLVFYLLFYLRLHFFCKRTFVCFLLFLSFVLAFTLFYTFLFLYTIVFLRLYFQLLNICIIENFNSLGSRVVLTLLESSTVTVHDLIKTDTRSTMDIF